MALRLPSHTQTLLRMEQTAGLIGVFITMYEYEDLKVVELCLRPMLLQNSLEGLQKVAFLNQHHVYGKANVFDKNGFPVGKFRWKSMPYIYYDRETIPAEMFVTSGQDVINIYLQDDPPEYASDFGEVGELLSPC